MLVCTAWQQHNSFGDNFENEFNKMSADIFSQADDEELSQTMARSVDKVSVNLLAPSQASSQNELVAGAQSNEGTGKRNAIKKLNNSAPLTLASNAISNPDFHQTQTDFGNQAEPSELEATNEEELSGKATPIVVDETAAKSSSVVYSTPTSPLNTSHLLAQTANGDNLSAQGEHGDESK